MHDFANNLAQLPLNITIKKNQNRQSLDPEPEILKTVLNTNMIKGDPVALFGSTRT